MKYHEDEFNRLNSSGLLIRGQHGSPVTREDRGRQFNRLNWEVEAA